MTGQTVWLGEWMCGTRCTRCKRGPARPGKTYCEPCAATERQREAQRQRNAKRLASAKAGGPCANCGTAPARPGKTRCGSCAADKKQRSAQRRAERRHAERHLRVPKGRFYRSWGECCRARIPSILTRAPEVFDRSLTAKVLRDMIEAQDRRCAWCRTELYPGTKAHVDHVVPLSRGGRSSPDNLRWLCDGCNATHRDKLDSELWLEAPPMWDGRAMAEVLRLVRGRLVPAAERKRSKKSRTREAALGLWGAA